MVVLVALIWGNSVAVCIGVALVPGEGEAQWSFAGCTPGGGEVTIYGSVSSKVLMYLDP